MASPAAVACGTEHSLTDIRRMIRIDAYDELFLSSSVVTFGVEKFAGGFRPIFQDRFRSLHCTFATKSSLNWRVPSTGVFFSHFCYCTPVSEQPLLGFAI